MCEIMTGATHLAHLKSIVIKHNEVGPKSMEQIIVLLDKQFPDNLEEFRLISCRTTALFGT